MSRKFARSLSALWFAMPLVLGSAFAAFAQEPAPAPTDPAKLESELRYQTGTVQVADGKATFNLGPEFRYLDPKQSARLLTEGWGNPPGAETLGMIFPSGPSPLSAEGWGVIITYEEDGYVDDKGAEKIDYNELLGEMKKSAIEENKERTKAGYDPIQLVGWAEPPRYDKASNKLYWAKDIKFGNAPVDTLNYNIRVLGRRGVLVLNAVSTVDQLSSVKTSMQQLLPAVEFNPGHRYADFIPGKDKMAEYGIGALVVGTLAAKTGLFKVLLAGLLAAKKFVILGIAGLGAWLRKMFKKKEPEATAEAIEP
ncbi:MAG TPA: DUF2167 domain-containing protein [Thermoanaerobaculia bacterium]|jgi:uncharacterized membrane-anchored protein|nr:DUF2167 domain-containing protein [Thermoanaerobaculia bacterium]